jgi:type II secretory ATPase GspE/PulE/Tfp pilus assembly ATPase PilB-like protein
MPKEDEELLTNWAHHAEGMMLCVGPTGCGKTTTSYALLTEMIKTRNILTVEDPVEFIIDGISQISINKEDYHLPNDFSAGIRSILRHDPDVIFLGEIRDSEAARAAVHASFSGHVLMSTMHARDPASAIILLRSMGIHDYEIAASLKIVLGQRILRNLCPKCKEKRDLKETEKEMCKKYNVHLDHAWAAKGCDDCSFTGYLGMSIIFELWELNENDYANILAHEDENKIRATIRKRNIKPMAVSALEMAKKGEIDLKEAMSVNV